MWLFPVFLPSALAQPCPGLAEQVEAGWEAFYDAELQRAAEFVVQANQSLGCQSMIVTPDELLRLYRLDALLAITNGDQKVATYATIRAVVLEPELEPPAELGPDLAEIHATWAGRLAQAEVEVRVGDGGEAWVDGRPVTLGSPLLVIAGEHLLQMRGPEDQIVSRVVEFDENQSIETGIPADPELLAEVEGARALAAAEAEAPAALDVPPSDRRSRRRHRVGLLLAGAATAAAGGVALGYAWNAESVFHKDPYNSGTYGGCGADAACYSEARRDAILSDAGRVRYAYAAGYALAVVGVGLVGTELVILPAPTGEGGGAAVSFRW